MDIKWPSSPLQISLSRGDILEIWGYWTVPGDDEKVPRCDQEIAWTSFATTKERRRQFLTETVFYVCPTDIKLSSADRDSIKCKDDTLAKGYDFTTEIGDYVATILYHLRKVKELRRKVKDSSENKLFTDEKLKRCVRRYERFLNSDRLEFFMLFLAYVCKICSNLAVKEQLDHMVVVIEEAESLMSYYSDKFCGYEELQRFSTQKLIDNMDASNVSLEQYNSMKEFGTSVTDFITC